MPDAFSSPWFCDGDAQVDVPLVPTKTRLGETISDQTTVHERFQVELLPGSLFVHLGFQPLNFFLQCDWFVHQKVRFFSGECVDEPLEFPGVFPAGERLKTEDGPI